MNKISLTLLSLLFPVFLTGCNNSDKKEDDQPTQSVDQYIGVWEKIGYGEYLDIGDTQVTRYEASNDSCIKTHTFSKTEYLSKLSWTVTGIEDDKFSAFLGTNSNTPFTIDKVTALPPSCETPLTNTPTNVINHLISMADAYYSFFDARNVDWSAVSEQARSAVTDDMSDEQLGGVIFQLLSVLEDAHVITYFNPLDLLAPEIDYNYLYPTYRAKTISNQFAAEYAELQSEQTFEQYTQEQIAIFNNTLLGDVDNLKSHDGKIIWGTKGDIGYIFVSNLDGFDPSNAGDIFSEAVNPTPHVAALNVVLDEVISDLQHTNGIILDLRLHSGGTTEMDRNIAQRFIDQDTHYGSFSAPESESTDLILHPYEGYRFDQQTVMITSELNQSSGEDLIMSLKADNNTIQIGEATQGIFSDMLFLSLPNQWVFSLSNQVWLDKDEISWETKGLQPDHEVTLYPLSDRQQGIDSTINKALSLLQ